MTKPGPVDLSLLTNENEGPRPGVDSEITWLLHRAAQRMRVATSEQSEKHGLHLREYIVRSALHKTAGLTQGELGKAVGLDKTTLTSELDRLEQRDLIVRTSHPRDRRIRIPQITETGEALRAEVAQACAQAEDAALSPFSDAEVCALRRMLFAIIGDHADPGSCL